MWFAYMLVINVHLKTVSGRIALLVSYTKKIVKAYRNYREIEVLSILEKCPSKKRNKNGWAYP